MRTSRLLWIRTPIAASAGLIAALASPLAARGDNWTTSNSGSISSLPTTRVGIGATPASNVHLDVTSNTSARIGLRVNQVQSNASVAEFRQNGTNKVVITSTGLLQATAGVTGTVSSGTAVSGSSTNGTGVSGTSTFQAGVTGTASQGGSGVSGTSLNGSGVQGSSTGDGIGVTGTGTGSVSVPFLSTTATGVFGSSSRGYGVYGRTTAGDGAAPLAGVVGQSATLNSFAPGVMGVYQGQDNQVPGVQGLALGPGGFTDFSSPGTGVQGVSGATGVEGISMGGMGVVGKTSGTMGATGVYGQVSSLADSNSAGVFGDSVGGAGTGVLGNSGTGWAVKGETSSSGVAVGGISAGGIGVYAQSNATGQPAVYAQAASRADFAFLGDGGIFLMADLAQKPNGGMWSPTASDRRVKKDVKDFERGLSDLMRVRPVRYKFNGLGGTTDSGKEYVGVIAQELEQVLPNMVTSRKRKLNQDDAQETDIKTIDPSDFTYILINAVKQQQHTIEQQNVRIEALERRTTPMTSSGVPRNLGWAALGLLPVGIFIGRRRQSRSAPTARRD